MSGLFSGKLFTKEIFSGYRMQTQRVTVPLPKNVFYCSSLRMFRDVRGPIWTAVWKRASPQDLKSTKLSRGWVWVWRKSKTHAAMIQTRLTRLLQTKIFIHAYKTGERRELTETQMLAHRHTVQSCFIVELKYRDVVLTQGPAPRDLSNTNVLYVSFCLSNARHGSQRAWHS